MGATNQDAFESGVSWPRSLGVYADLVYSRGAGGLYANMAFGEYVAALAERVERVVVFGRLDLGRDGGEHLLGERVEFVEFPYYASVAHLPAVYRSIPAAKASFADAARGLDALWVFGPHPVSLALVRAARRRGLPVLLGVRQDQPRYMRARLAGVRRLLAPLFFGHLERRWRRIARELPTVVAGDELARLYGGGATVRSTAFTLVRDADMPTEPAVRPIGPGARLEIVAVGRLDREKNPLLLALIAGELRRRDPGTRFRLRVVGDGPLAGELSAEVERLGLGDCVKLTGYVPFGPELQAIYESSDVFLHVSHTEGLPQVLIEALAAGLPIVGTAVGGVPALLEPTGAPLVPPDDAGAAAAALVKLAADRERRLALAVAGLARARAFTVERQQAGVLDFFAARSGP